MRRLLLGLPLVVLMIAGCGADRPRSVPEPSPEARADATAAAVAYVRAITSGKAASACALLTEGAHAEIRRAGHASCPAYITVVRGDLPVSPALRSVTLRDFQASMKTAQAVGTSTRLKLIGDGLPDGGLPLVRASNRWQLAAAF